MQIFVFRYVFDVIILGIYNESYRKFVWLCMLDEKLFNLFQLFSIVEEELESGMQKKYRLQYVKLEYQQLGIGILKRCEIYSLKQYFDMENCFYNIFLLFINKYYNL